MNMLIFIQENMEIHDHNHEDTHLLDEPQEGDAHVHRHRHEIHVASSILDKSSARGVGILHGYWGRDTYTDRYICCCFTSFGKGRGPVDLVRMGSRSSNRKLVDCFDIGKFQ